MMGIEKLIFFFFNYPASEWPTWDSNSRSVILTPTFSLSFGLSRSLMHGPQGKPFRFMSFSFLLSKTEFITG